MPVVTLVSDNKTARETPTERQSIIIFLGMLPPVILSICSVNTFTDGSACTI